MGRILLMLLLFYFDVKSSLSLSYSSSTVDSFPLCLPEESSALLHFKTTLSLDFSYYSGFACDSTSPPKTNSWNETTNCCLWEGVTCDKVTAHVVALDLSCSWLIGSLPPPKKPLFLPPRLQRLNFARNNLDGSISSAATLLSQLSLTHLDLSYNYFSGPISTSFLSQFVSLTHLDLSFNQFSGSIPSEISLLSNLVSLDLASNDELTLDEHSFDLLARNLSKLTNLNFGDIDMSCVPPPSLLNLTSTLKHLSLSSCELDGEVPSEVFRFPYLQYLDLSWNQNLTGYLPKSNNWTSPLKHLDLRYCNFGGEIPASLGNLTQITFLALEGNVFGGEIPDVFGSLKKLAGLLWLDTFSGQLPSSIFNLTQVIELALCCDLEGVLPSHSGLQNLHGLHLSDNLISGEVPSWLFALPSFRILDLSNNKLLSLPTDDQIQNPSSLKEIYLRSNHIHGSIPSFLFHHLVNLTQLDLSSNNLSGVITSDMLAKAKSLHTLDLSSNSQLSLTNSHIHHDNYTFNELYNVTLFSCNITRFPSFLQTAKKLRYLDLSKNKIEGSISKSDSEGWEQLTELYLSHNSLTSVEQYWQGQKLQTIDVSANQLHGEIPTSFCNMSSLQNLDLSVNNLGGIIPSCLATSPPFTELRLQLNNFHGQIPAFESGALRTLALNDNQLEGLLPRSLVNCISLIFLNVANNKLNDTFPYWLGKIPSLQFLVLGSNRFHGPLENVIAPSSFPRLEIIDLSQNVFTGTLPTNLLNLTSMKYERGPCKFDSDENEGCTFLLPDQNYVEIVIKKLQLKMNVGPDVMGFTIIDFSDNQFYGGIPEVLGKLGALLVLNLSHNHLSGSIPPTLGHMAALESLDLSSNKLGGRIPPELTNLIFLEVLNLSHNNLSGPIPQGKQFNTFDNDSYIGNPGLWGCPLSKECHNIFKKQPQPRFVDQHEDGDGDDDSGLPFIWKIVAMGYGCGIVLGLSTGYIMFTTGRPWWIVGKIERYLQQRVTNWICKIQGRRSRRN